MPDTAVPVKKDDAKALALRRTSLDFWQSFHKEIDRLFERFSRGLPLSLNLPKKADAVERQRTIEVNAK